MEIKRYSSPSSDLYFQTSLLKYPHIQFHIRTITPELSRLPSIIGNFPIFIIGYLPDDTNLQYLYLPNTSPSWQHLELIPGVDISSLKEEEVIQKNFFISEAGMALCSGLSDLGITIFGQGFVFIWISPRS